MFQKTRKNLRRNNGFTLVELVVVIAILGILIALAIPQFGAVLKKSRARSDLVNAATIANAVNRAVAEQEIDVSESGATVSVSELVNKKFLQVEPKPKLISNTQFQASIDSDGKVTVTVSGSEVYPNPGGQYAEYADEASK